MSYIKSFKINKLFGFRTVKITQNEDYIILVGENGSGKSTIMNCLFFVLTKNFEELAKIDFESIEIEFEGSKKFLIFRKDIKSERTNVNPLLSISEILFVRRLKSKLDEEDFSLLRTIIEKYDYSPSLVRRISLFLERRNISYEVIQPHSLLNCVKVACLEATTNNLELTIRELEKYLGPQSHVFHFTTYRRVETSMDAQVERGCSEIVYGMKDVEQMLAAIQTEIKDRNKVGFNKLMVSLLNKLVLKEDHQEILNLDEKKVKIVLSRLGSQLSRELNDTIIQYCHNKTEKNSELDYLIEELIKLYEQQEMLDNSIDQFCTRCNKYLSGKQFTYDVDNVRVEVRSNYDESVIALEALSSGEKQMIGLMAKMYLSKEKDFVVLIDEPELSLSIRWQQTILEDMIQSGKIKYMMAVTHSPFIYNNSLSKYAKGISNFI